MESMATAIDAVEFEVVRRGYESVSVDDFLMSLRKRATTLEDQLRRGQVKVATLEKKIAGIQEREAATEAAYFAATEATQKLLEEAEAKAAEIIREATAGASAEDGDGEHIRRDAERILLQAKKQLKAVERERAAAESQTETLVREAQRRADDLVASVEAEAAERVAAATDEGRSIVTQARRVALETVAGSQRDAEELLSATRLEQNQIIEHLRALKAAVADMLETGAESSERIRVILSDATVATEAPAGAPVEATGGAVATA